MVLVRHSPLPDSWWLKQVGWLGVDLFFVLSGFLVSRLLFQEFEKTGTVRPLRFLIRRGFKIYPSYYVFIGATALYPYLMYGRGYSWKLLVLESAFVQNYVPAIWIHTWSLAVEEHFYFALAGLTFLFMYRKWLGQPKIVFSFLTLLWGTVVALRWLHCQGQPETFYFFQTHLRADGLILGVGLAYGVQQYHWKEIIRRWRNRILPMAVLLCLPAVLWPAGSYVMNVAGLPLINLGFALWVGLSLCHTQPTSRWLHPLDSSLRLLGQYSYNVYLWHMLVRLAGQDWELGTTTFLLLYFTGSLLLGLGATWGIEKPMLKIRDRIWAHYD